MEHVVHQPSAIGRDDDDVLPLVSGGKTVVGFSARAHDKADFLVLPLEGECRIGTLFRVVPSNTFIQIETV